MKIWKWRFQQLVLNSNGARLVRYWVSGINKAFAFYIGVCCLASSTISAMSLDPQDLLSRISSIDAVYEAGFTASGTMTEIDKYHDYFPPFKKKWQLTIHGRKKAYEEEVIEILRWEDVLEPGEVLPVDKTPSDRAGNPLEITDVGMPLRVIQFIGDSYQAMLDFGGDIPSAGPLPQRTGDSTGLALSAFLLRDDPVTGRFTFFFKRALWSIGRGYSKHIHSIDNICEDANGFLAVTAYGTNVSGRDGTKWELLIDPHAAYMIRSARMYDGRHENPTISLTNSGLKWFGNLCIPEATTWIDRYSTPREMLIETEAASFQPDLEFYERVATMLEPPYPLHTDIVDHSAKPPLTMQYRAGELFPKDNKIAEDAMVFGQLDESYQRAPSLPNGAAQQEISNEPMHDKIEYEKTLGNTRGTGLEIHWKRSFACIVLLVSTTCGIVLLVGRIVRRRASDH